MIWKIGSGSDQKGQDPKHWMVAALKGFKRRNLMNNPQIAEFEAKHASIRVSI